MATSPQKVDEVATLQQAENLDEATLLNWIKTLADAYYNDQALVSDQTFDALVSIYERRFKKYTQVGALPRGHKVDLPFYLPSLDKMTTADEIQKWTQRYPGPYVLEDKIDGITLLYDTKMVSGKPVVNLYTRGTGTVGSDITHMYQYLNLPQMNGDISIRGELVLTRQAFAEIGQGYESARNLTTGIVGARDSFDPEKARKLKFYAYQIMGSTETPETQVLQLRQAGFDIPWAGTSPTLTFEQLTSINQNRKDTAPYEIDGIVVYQNQVVDQPLPGKKYPKNVIAFKMPTETAETTVKEIIWEASKNNLLKPVVVYEPVFLDNAVLERASGYNARFVFLNMIGPGARIKITRSGSVIPKILEILEPATEYPWPDKTVHGEYDWNENQVELVTKADTVQVKAARIRAFLEKLGIENVGPTRVMSMVQSGLTSIHDILTATPERFTQVERIGPKLASQIYNDLQRKIQNVPPARLMAASGVFPNVGERRFNEILRAYPQFLAWVDCDVNQISQAIRQVKGFKNLAEDIAAKMSDFGEWLRAHPMITVSNVVPATCPSPSVSPAGPGATSPTLLTVQEGGTSIPQNLNGVNVVFSGFRNRDLQDRIEARGGQVRTSVSRNTNYLVMKDTSDVKGKAERALQLGIPLISMEDFQQQFLSS